MTMARSLQTRLLCGTTLGTAVVLIVSGVVLHAVIKSALLAEFDATLHSKARTLANLVEQEGDVYEVEIGDVKLMEFSGADRPEYFEIRLPDGALVARSQSLGDRALALPNGRINESSTISALLPDGRPGRLAHITFTPRSEEDHPQPDEAPKLTLWLARDTLDLQGVLDRLRFGMLVVGLCALTLTIAVLLVTVRAGLRPVSDLAEAISRVDESSLSAVIDRATAPNELQPVIRRLNELLVRLADAFDREKALTANVAHELRTPLAGIRATAEVILSRERDAEQYRAALDKCLHICRSTQDLVEMLLMLARMDAGSANVEKSTVKLADLLKDAWKPFERYADDKKLTVVWDVNQSHLVSTDPDKLRVVVGNLIDNAVRHVDHGGRITIATKHEAYNSFLTITNTGSRVAPEDTPRVFERFWRGDTSRAGSGSHCGLGLPLCKSIVERLGGEIHATSQMHGAFSIAITL